MFYQKITPTMKLALSGVLIALGVALSAFHIPFLGAKCFPIQHLINVLAGVLLGPLYAVLNAFLISLIRNMLGMGSLLAFPGSMVGAFLAGIFYQKLKHYRWACLGEVLGTGILGALIAAPVAVLLMGREVGLFVYILPFALSSALGSIIALVFLETTQLLSFLSKKGKVGL